jgi:hypothetical protein
MKVPLSIEFYTEAKDWSNEFQDGSRRTLAVESGGSAWGLSKHFHIEECCFWTLDAEITIASWQRYY